MSSNRRSSSENLIFAIHAFLTLGDEYEASFSDEHDGFSTLADDFGESFDD